jgi:hypothetical protein
MHIDAGVMSIDAGIGIKARGGSRVSFIISEIALANDGLGIGTRLTTGAANSYSGNILYARDDASGTLFETGVDGDVFNIQGGSFIVNTLYDLGVNSTLSAFATEGSGAAVADASALVNLSLAGNGQQTISRDIVTQTLIEHVDGVEATETIIDFGTMTTQDFDIVAGEVEVLSVMSQVSTNLEIHLIKTGAQDAELGCWLEASADGVVWVAIADSLRREVVNQNGASNFVADFSFNVPLPVGGKFRIVATNLGADTLSIEAPPSITTANGGATGFAKTIRLVKIR